MIFECNVTEPIRHFDLPLKTVEYVIYKDKLMYDLNEENDIIINYRCGKSYNAGQKEYIDVSVKMNCRDSAQKFFDDIEAELFRLHRLRFDIMLIKGDIESIKL